MQYAQLNEDGSYGYQITTSGNVRWDENNYCSAASLIADGKGSLFRVVELRETEPPAIDETTQSVLRDGGELLDGHWHYRWKIETLADDLIAKNLDKVAERERAKLILAAQNTYIERIKAIEAAYIPKERETWVAQIRDAEAYLADAEADTPFLNGMLIAKAEMTKAQLVAKIMGNYSVYSGLAGEALGDMQEAIRAIEAE